MFAGPSAEVFAGFLGQMKGYGATLYLADDPDTPIEAAIIGSAEDDQTHGFRWDSVRFVRARDDEYDVATLIAAGAHVETALVHRVVIA